MAGVTGFLGVLAVVLQFSSPAINPYIKPAATNRAQRTCADSAYIVTASGLKYCVLKRGSGEPAKLGERATMHETTTLMNGTVIFESYSKNSPITFLLGGKQVIDGVDEGVTGMRVGEIRRLLVPPTLSVRASYPANTPRDSTLRIDVELLSIKRP